LEASVKFAKERELYGKPIASLQSLAFKLADMETKIEAMKLLIYKAAWLIDQDPRGPQVGGAVSMAKTYASETAVDIIVKAIEIHGAYGTVPEYPLIRYMHDALPIISAAGTTDIMRVIQSGGIIRK
jgi:alkylation response protein AidB-like acyl-CoA dehydrogenase